MAWIKLRNAATGAVVEMPDSALREMTRAGWVQVDDPPEPPQEPESKPASKRSRKAASQAGELASDNQQEQPEQDQEGN